MAEAEKTTEESEDQVKENSKNTTKKESLPRQSSWLEGATKVFENEVISLAKMLQQRESDDDFKAIGFVGMRGVGKTTLCQVLFNKTEVKTHFLPRILVRMSNKEEDAEPKAALVKRMLISLGVDDKIIESIFNDHGGIDGLLYALYLQLKGKRYLIVLDGAWDIADHDQWYQGLDSPITDHTKWGERLAYGFPKGYGGTVIVTSRSEEIAKKMVGGGDIKNIYRLLPLSDPESCWSIFRDTAGKDSDKFAQQNLEELKKELTRKCAGLPLAAKLLGQSVIESKRHRQ